MDGLAVPLEPLRVDKGLGAEGAGVRPLARVDEAVPLEAGRVLVRLSTVRALVRPGKVKITYYLLYCGSEGVSDKSFCPLYCLSFLFPIPFPLSFSHFLIPFSVYLSFPSFLMFPLI